MCAKKKITPKSLQGVEDSLIMLIEQVQKQLKLVDSTTVGGRLKRFKFRNVIKYLRNALNALKA